MSGFNEYQKDDGFWKAVKDWHGELDKRRGQRAELRRAKTPTEVVCAPAYHRGFAAFLATQGYPLGDHDLRRLAPAAGLLAHVTTLAEQGHFARQLAASQKGSQEVRDQRFKKLMAIDDHDELYVMLRRLIRYFDGHAHMQSLVTGVYFWGDGVKRQWAMNYFTHDS